MKMKIALGQMDIQLGQPTQNIAKVRQFIAEAKAEDADLLILPELWSTGYDLERAEKYATAVDEGIFAQIEQMAKENGLAIAGSCLAHTDQGISNTLVWWGKDGQRLAVYSKIHLFQLMDEHLHLASGKETKMVHTPWGKVGLSICYDLRFPELFRGYAVAGAEMAIIPAEWPHPRLNHWRTLLQARAIENQMFVIACNRVGVSKETHFCGHSTIIDPWGERLVEADESEGVWCAEIDVTVVAQVRQKIPVFQDRRPSLYTL